MTQPVTVGIDIGTSSVKAVAADADGTVVASARVPHSFSVPAPLQFEHDARGRVVRRTARRARGARRRRRGRRVGRGDGAVAHCRRRRRQPVCARPSVRRRARPRRHRATRSRAASSVASSAGSPPRFPTHAGSGPPRPSPTSRSCGEPVLSTTAAMLAYPLFDWRRAGTKPALESVGVRLDQMPTLALTGTAAAEVAGRPGCVLEGGTIDAMGEQIVAGADNDGDVLVICGTTLIVWCVTPELADGAGLLPDAAHDEGQVPRRRTEQRGGPVPRLGPAPAARRGTGDRPRARAGVGSVPARRTHAA